ncbi:uncharacterized protein LOC143018980 [Oratosquilla oratoria]|uniref:uncharacterized protein LOC143018980 n=1 Tax=Oratosquilla oratoria TaxID=337810 RepID=UPI003F7723A6
MADMKETTALLGYGRGSEPKDSDTPPTPHRSIFESVGPYEVIPRVVGSQESGLSVTSSICYLLGLVGVMPIVALPGAIVFAGWAGFVLTGVLLVAETYTAVLLGRSWLLMEVFWPRDAAMYKRYPYPALAEKAGGPILRRFVTVLLDLAIFGATIPFMLLAAETMQELVATASGGAFDLSFCYWLLLLTIILTPLLWLGTPKDFGLVTWVGAGTAIIVSLLTLVALVLDAPAQPRGPPPEPTWAAVAYCFGAVAFQFDIHPMILTVAMDMKEKFRLPLVVMSGFTLGGGLSVTVAAVAYSLYGNAVTINLLNTLASGPLLYTIMAIITVQVLICLVLGINTLFQDLEDNLNIPNEFGWRRVVLRTFVMLLVLFVCESIPHLGVAIELVGGLLVTPFIFIFPPIFHLLIKYRAFGRVEVKDLVLGSEVVALGIAGCIAATAEGFIQVSRLGSLAPPCYINSTVSVPSTPVPP